MLLPAPLFCFLGVLYNPLDVNNKVYNLTSEVYYQSINLNGALSNVIFNRLFGNTNNFGSIILKSRKDNSLEKIIYIYPSGFSSLSDYNISSEGRLIDSRHLHFNLGWSIQNAVTLTLKFKEIGQSDVVNDIVMTPYFSENQTEFNWSGAIVAFGQMQYLKIHTHFLDATNTILCIHRDGELNSKALEVFIDNKLIVSYDAAGVANVGAFGGIMEVQ